MEGRSNGGLEGKLSRRNGEKVSILEGCWNVTRSKILSFGGSGELIFSFSSLFHAFLKETIQAKK